MRKYRLRHIIFPVDHRIFRKVLMLALPVIFGNLSRVLMNMADVAMVGRLGAASIAAVGMGGILVWALISFGIAIRTGVQTVTSRRLGEGRYEECGAALTNGLVFAIAIGLLLSAVGNSLTVTIMSFLLDDPEVSALAVDYTRWAFLSVLFATAGFAYQGFFNGVEKTNIHMRVTVTANVLNVYLNAGLIFGSADLPRLLSDTSLGNVSVLAGLWTPFHFPELGVEGAGIATFLASIWLSLHYSFYALRGTFRKELGAFQRGYDRHVFRRVVAIATPQGLQEMGLMLGFVLFFKIVAMVGTLELAATEVVFTIMQASFLPAAGFGIACATLVGKSLGEKNPDRAEVSIVESVRWSMVFMGSMGLLFIVFPDQILPAFTNDEKVITLGVVALRILGVVQFADAVGMTLWFALSGAGNTKFPAIVEMVIVWGFFLPVCYITAVWMDMGILGSWISLGLYILFFAIAVSWKVLQGDWKEIKV